MTVKPTQIQNLDRTVSDLYVTALQGAAPVSQELLYRQDIDSTKFVHAFLEGVPQFRDWDGPKIAKSVAIGEIAGTVKRKELTVKVPVDDVNSPRISRYLQIATNIGIEAGHLPDQMLAAWLEGATAAGDEYNNYDGVATFTQHTTDSGHSNDNDLSLSLSATNLKTAVEAMMDFKNEEGTILGVNPSHIIVPNALFYTALEIFKNSFDASGASNIFFEYPLKIVRNPYLTTTNAWYLVDARKFEPFSLYVFQDPSDITIKDQPKDDNVFWDDYIVWSAVGKLGVRPAPYQFLLRSAG